MGGRRAVQDDEGLAVLRGSFETIDEAGELCMLFFAWYNEAHHRRASPS